MQPRELLIEKCDPTPVTLDEFQSRDALKKLGDLMSLIGYQRDLITNDQLTVGMRNTCCSLLKAYGRELGELLGFDAGREDDGRLTRLREANERIRMLEERLGQAANDDMVAERLKLAKKAIDAWWDEVGFGHISSIIFDDYAGTQVDLSCMPSCPFTHLVGGSSRDAAVEQKWFESLQERGFHMVREKGSCRELSVVDDDHNREMLTRLVCSRFPSARLTGTKNHIGAEGAILWTFSFRIGDFCDIITEAT